MSSLSKSYDPKSVEPHWAKFWEEKGVFRADPQSKKPPFCIVIPPPNVTGVLHMGHALVDTLQDILIRWKKMEGYEVLWLPGTDHAGIATQGVVERRLFQETGKRRSGFSREEFLGHVWAWKEKSEKEILGQLKRLGCSCDWSRLRFTMDAGCSKAVRTLFKKMYEEDLIYQGDYLVNWDPVTGTALSDDEVEHEERSSFLWHIRYPTELNPGQGIEIATTRPETLLGDTAVAVHPKDSRYRAFIGKKLVLPLTGRTIPVIADEAVDPEFGTGAVKITPAHDFHDFEMGLRHNLPRINIMTPDGKINEAGGVFSGLSMKEAREAIVQALSKEGFLVRKEPHTLRVGLSYRSKAVIEPYLSKQWFVRVTQFKDKLISAVKEKRVKLLPPHWESTYYHWIENLRDWCISRQIWWGHRIPIWTHKKTGQILCEAEEEIPHEVKNAPEEWEQDPDVLDTWFSSALWPFSSLGWPDQTPELNRFYPTATLITGHDILFFWVARMILMGEYVLHEVPFHETFLHGLIYGKSYWRVKEGGHIEYVSSEEKKKYDLGEKIPADVDSKWEKMSKSKGNVLDPLEIIEEYGTDALRLTLAASTTGARQIDLDRRRFEEYKNFANKIWNGARFVLIHLETLSFEAFAHGIHEPLLALEDRWILRRLSQVTEEMKQALSNYAFDKAAHLGYSFFWNEFCAIFLELAKPALFGKREEPHAKTQKQILLAIVLLSALRLLHPMIPFLTEELFTEIQKKLKSPTPVKKSKDRFVQEALQALETPCCAMSSYPASIPIVEGEEGLFEELLEIVRAIRNLRTEMSLPPGEKNDLYVIGEGIDKIRQHQEILLALTPTENIFFSKAPADQFGATAAVLDVTLFLPLPEALKEKEALRLAKEKEKLEKQIEATKARLQNREFLEKAPRPVVEKLEASLQALETQYRELQF